MIMKKEVFALIAGALALNAMSCSQKEEYGSVLKSDEEYDTSPDVDESDLDTLCSGNSAFAFELYKQLISTTNDSLFYSPYSISIALAMAYAGANGETEEQMADVLKFMLDNDDLHAAFNKLSIELNSRDDVTNNEDAQGFQLSVVNAIWGQTDYKFNSAFLDVLAKNYDAGIRLLDYINKTEQSRITINDWVSEQTKQRIKDLIPQGAISGMTRLVLTNAIYFKAAWLNQFEKNNTHDDSFYLLDGSEVTASMMHQSESFGYTEGNGYQAVELQYDTNELSMIIIAPEAGYFEDFESSLTSDVVEGIIDDIDYQEVELTMPKFSFSSQFSLNDVLQAMGISDAFDSSRADFSGMTDEDSLFISNVIHKAFVSVDEEGTEAAAASAVIMDTTGMPLEPAVVVLDHPFIFFIRDIATNTILFIGRVVNPAV
jgi:serpin B